jgi:hypothetical protein
MKSLPQPVEKSGGFRLGFMGERVENMAKPCSVPGFHETVL